MNQSGDLQRRTERFHKFSVALANAATIEQLLLASLPLIAETLEVDTVIALQLEGQDHLSLLLAHANGKPDTTPSLLALSDLPTARHALEKKAPTVLHSASADLSGGESDLLAEHQLQTLLCLPLIASSEAFGLLACGTTAHHSFSPAEIQTALTLANQLAIALTYTRLFELEHKRLGISEILVSTTRALGITLDLNVILDTLVAEAVKLFQADAVALWTWDSAEENLFVRASHGLSNEFVEQQQLPKEQIRHYISGEPHPPPFVVTTLGDEPFTDEGLVRQEKLYSALVAPMVDEAGRVTGALTIFSKDKPRNFDRRELELAPAFTGQAETAIERAELFQTVQRHLNELTILRQVAVLSSQAVSVDILLSSVTELMSSLFKREGFGFLMIEDETNILHIHPAYNSLPEDVKSIEIPLGEGITGHAAQTGQTLVVDDTTKDERFIDFNMNMRSEVAIPIKIGAEVVGVLNVESREANAFDESDVRFLETLVEQLSSAIERVQLYEALNDHAEQLELAHILQQQMIQSVAHELRTPLTYITSYVELIQDPDYGALSDEQKDMLDIIDRKADTLNNLISDFVTLQAFDAEALALEVEPVQPQALLREALVGCAAWAQQAKVTIVEDIPGDLPQVMADSFRIMQVMDNLLSNAIKFSPEGGQMTVAAQVLSGMVEIRISDTGIGIAPEFQERIFDRFYQVDGTSTRRYGGLGLGLPISREIVRAHDGDIRVDSTGVLGEGTIFSFTLPVAK